MERFFLGDVGMPHRLDGLKRILWDATKDTPNLSIFVKKFISEIMTHNYAKGTTLGRGW